MLNVRPDAIGSLAYLLTPRGIKKKPQTIRDFLVGHKEEKEFDLLQQEADILRADLEHEQGTGD